MSERYVYGIHAVSAVLNHPEKLVKRVYVSQQRSDGRIQQLLDKIAQENLEIIQLSAQEMNQRFGEYTHQGLVAVTKPLPQYYEKDLPFLLSNIKQPSLILILDGVTDPHNLGACLRSADGAGVDFVIIPKDKNASLSPIVSKVACGAAEYVPLVTVTNLARAIDMLKKQGIWVYGAAGEAELSLYDHQYNTSVAIIMGAEDKGIRRLTREHCDGLFSIPMLGSVSSLNVSVATGISLYEVVRQRKSSF